MIFLTNQDQRINKSMEDISSMQKKIKVQEILLDSQKLVSDITGDNLTIEQLLRLKALLKNLSLINEIL